MTRDQARAHIVSRANRGSYRTYTPRHLQRAVSIVRARRSVEEQVLVDAGFNAHGPRYRAKR